MSTSLVFGDSNHLLIGRFAASNEKNHFTLEKLSTLNLPHQVYGNADKGDEHAPDANHGQHPWIQFGVI